MGRHTIGYVEQKSFDKHALAVDVRNADALFEHPFFIARFGAQAVLPAKTFSGRGFFADCRKDHGHIFRMNEIPESNHFIRPVSCKGETTLTDDFHAAVPVVGTAIGHPRQIAHQGGQEAFIFRERLSLVRHLQTHSPNNHLETDKTARNDQ
ncbi:MAG: hypothetical protein ACD_75C02348G0002 [uncultured bacterium]|nr:MAG: hypothetical protein ACD_75C02348G0002 [uncultured bacterium]